MRRSKRKVYEYRAILKYVIGLILCIGFLLQAGSVITYAKTYDGFRYQYNEEYGGIEITKYKGKAQKLVIPDEIEGIPVVAIGYNAFWGNKFIKKAVIPDRVKYIDECTFVECKKLKSVIMPKEILKWRESTFTGCSSLKTVKLPENITAIPQGTFANTGLKSFHVPKQVQKMEDSVFSGCQQLKNVTFDKNAKLEFIGWQAFDYCTAMEEIKLPASVIELGQEVFQDCLSLKKVTFAKNSKLKILGYGVFNRCKELDDVTIPKNVTQIKSYAFGYCINLKTVTFQGKCPKLEKEVFDEIHWAATFQVPSKYKKSYEKNMHKFGWYYAIK